MFQKWLFSIVFAATVALGSFHSASAQSTPRALLWDSEFDVTLPSESDLSYTFGVGNRYLINEKQYGEQMNENDQQHFEINQFTNYNTSENATVSLGFRYRFRENFESSRHNEFRIIEQFVYEHNGSALTPAHRFRFEQRFRDVTIFRLRYRFGISQPLGEEFGVGLSTEFLYSMVQGLRPEADQRLTLELENSSFENLELSAGLEFRREDFAGAPGTEVFVLTGASLDL